MLQPPFGKESSSTRIKGLYMDYPIIPQTVELPVYLADEICFSTRLTDVVSIPLTVTEGGIDVVQVKTGLSPTLNSISLMVKARAARDQPPFLALT